MAGDNVPGIDNAPQFQTQGVPGVNFPMRGATAAGEMISRGGRGVQQGAADAAEIYDGIELQHDIAGASLAAAQGTVQLSQMRQQAQLESPDGFVRDPDTGEVVKNKVDGSRVTIAQKYWEDADSFYQNAQQDMSPRQSAMYREKMQRTIVDNTQMLQMEGMRLQAQSSEQKIGMMKDTYSKDFDRSFVPDTNPYYPGVAQDGSSREYPSAQKFYDALHDTQLTRQQMGPVQGRPGLYGPTEVEALKQGDSSELANNWLTSAKLDLVDPNGSRVQLQNQQKEAPATALMQIQSLLDIVEGRDPQSLRRTSVGLPTMNSSLTPAQVSKWRAEFTGMMDSAKDVDKSEYELSKQQVNAAAKGTQNMDQFMGSDLMRKTILMGGGLQLPPAQRAKDLFESVATASAASAIAATGGINSAESKRQMATQVMLDNQKRWPQLAGMLGVKDTQGFADAINAEVGKQVTAKLEEDARQMRESPMGYAAALQDGPQGPGGTPKYRDPMAHAIQDRLDPSKDPSLFAIFKPMPGGKSVLESAQSTADNVYARMFHSKANVSVLTKSQFEDQVERLKNAKDPSLVEDYFNKLNALPEKTMSAAQKETFTQGLIHQGGLPATYVDALNLISPTERKTRWTDLQAGPPPMPDGMTSKRNEADSAMHNKPLFNYLDLKYGPNSTEGRINRNTYDKAWQSDRLNAMNRGMSENESADYADNQRDKTTSGIGVVGGQHDFFGTGLFHYGTVGPQVPVEYGSNKYTPQQKQNINDVLLKAQGLDALSKQHFVHPNNALPENPNAPGDAENVAANVAFWRRIGGGWRLQQQELDNNNQPTGKLQDVQVFGKDTMAHTYDIRDSEALAGLPQGSPQAVKPAEKHRVTIEMGPPKL